VSKYTVPKHFQLDLPSGRIEHQAAYNKAFVKEFKKYG